jgi:membrane protease YdiL (CAAX protease family)
MSPAPGEAPPAQANGQWDGSSELEAGNQEGPVRRGVWSAAELWLGAVVVLPLLTVAFLLAAVPLAQLPLLSTASFDLATPIAGNVAYVVIAGATAGMFLWGRKIDVNAMMGPGLTLRSLLLVLAGLAVTLVLTFINLALAPSPAPAVSDPGTALLQPEPLLDTLSAVVAAPVVEEILFRLVLFAGFSAVYGPVRGAIFSSAIFAAYHLNVWAFPHHFAFGIVAAFLYLRTRSLLPSVVFHSAWNALVTIVAASL